MFFYVNPSNERHAWALFDPVIAAIHVNVVSLNYTVTVWTTTTTPITTTPATDFSLKPSGFQESLVHVQKKLCNA